MQTVVESGKRLNITATNTSLSGGHLMGIFVSSASSTPTIKVADSKGTIANTFNVVESTYYPLPCQFLGTLTVTLGGTVDATIFYV